MAPMQPGARVLAQYVVDAPLGAGGMGRVYRGRRLDDGAPVAIKCMGELGGPALRARFAREALLLARVRHPSVVSVLDAGFLDDDQPCIVMELLEGETLEARLADRVTLPWREAVEVLLGVLSGLAAMHGAGVLHHDLKPSNVLLQNGRLDAPKLIDFGIAALTSEGGARPRHGGVLVGTPEYLSPEQLRGAAVSERTDLYAAGLMLYELLTGALPLVGEGLSLVSQRVSTPCPAPVVPAQMPTPPPALRAALMSALAIDPMQRPESAHHFAAQLDAARHAAEVDAVVTFRRQLARGTPITEPEVIAGRGLQVRALVAARVSLTAEIRAALTACCEGFGAGFALGDGLWVALQRDAVDAISAQVAAERLINVLSAQLGATLVVWRMVEPSFTLSPAMLSGEAPLHPSLKALVAALGWAPSAACG